MSSYLYEKLKKLALAFIRAHDEQPPWNPDNLWRYRSEDCVQSLYPKESIPSPFDEDLGKEQYYQALYFFGGIITKSRFDIGQTVVDVEQRKAVVSINAKLDLKAVGDEPEEKEWPASYVLIITMDKEANKIVRAVRIETLARLGCSVSGKTASE